MEKVKKAKLHQIFKFSVIVNILPFYGDLSRWHWLMNRLNSATKMIWDNNWDAFFNCGKDCKIIIFLDSFKESKLMIKVIKSKYHYFKHFVITSNMLYSKLKAILSWIKNNMAVWIEENFEDNYGFILKIIPEKSISDYFSITKWPNYKYDSETFTYFTQKKIDSILDNWYAKIFTKSKNQNKIKVDYLLPNIIDGVSYFVKLDKRRDAVVF